jgi:hypothetical protein
MKRSTSSKPIYKEPVFKCGHMSWIPTRLAPELYEQCACCGIKRYRDPAKRQPKKEKEQANEQLSLF